MILAILSRDCVQDLRTVGLSAVTGQGCASFFKEVSNAVTEYYEEYVPHLEELRKIIEKRKEDEMDAQLKKLKVSIAIGSTIILIFHLLLTVLDSCPFSWPCRTAKFLSINPLNLKVDRGEEIKLEADMLNPTQTTNLPPSFSNYHDSDDNNSDEEVRTSAELYLD